MISAHNLSVKLGKKQILRDLDFCFQNGKVTALLGKNGSGKTTLLRAAAGTIPTYSGSVCLDGMEVKRLAASALSAEISLLPQFLPKPAIRVEELVSYGRAPYTGITGRLKEKDMQEVENALRMTGMKSFAKSLVCHLSGGERQLSFFAMVLAQQASNILLDEPTASLDTANRKILFDCISNLKEENRSVILSLHDLNEAVSIADEICVLENGKIIFQGETEVFTESGVPENVFGLTKIQIPGRNLPFYAVL